MTPARLVQLECPNCAASHWEIDSDFRGMGGNEPSYGERAYACPACGGSGPGYAVKLQSPPELFLQPHDMYPMSPEEFRRWLPVVREHFPAHPQLERLGLSWYPGKRHPNHRDLDHRTVLRHVKFSVSLTAHVPHDPQTPVFVQKSFPVLGEAVFSMHPEVALVRVCFGFADPEMQAKNFPPDEVSEIVAFIRDHQNELRAAWQEHDRELTTFQQERMVEIEDLGASNARPGFFSRLFRRPS